MPKTSKPPISDRMGNSITKPNAQKPKLVGFLRVVHPTRNEVPERAGESDLSSGMPRHDFHTYAGRRFFCVFETQPVVGEECVVAISGTDRLGGGEAHGVRLLVQITALDSNDAETRYREQRGLVAEDRNVAGQFHAVGEIIRNV